MLLSCSEGRWISTLEETGFLWILTEPGDETSVRQCSAWNEDFNARECSWTHASSVPTWSCSQLRNWPDGSFARVQAAAEGILVIKHDVMTMEINENPPLVNDFPIQGIDFQAAVCIWTAQNDMS